MPPKKRKSTEAKSNAATKKRQKKDAEAPQNNSANENASAGSDSAAAAERDPDSIPDHEYVCVTRPRFDIEAEGEKDESETDSFDVCVEIYEREKKDDRFTQPASENKDFKWIMLWGGWKKYIQLSRQAKYCNPDNFNMYIYNDFWGYGLVEQIENMIVAFDKEFKKKKRDETTLLQMWAIVSALALALNGSNELDAYVLIDDGDRATTLTGLIGSAFLTALHALEEAGELKQDSKFLDLPLVMGYFLEVGHRLPDYDIEGDGAAWLRHVVEYYERSKISPTEGVFSTSERLESLTKRFKEEAEEEDEDEYIKRRTKNDPWAWDARLDAYESMYASTLGGNKFDITKMSRKERAKHAFDKKDPLADISDDGLEDVLLDFE